MKEFKSFLFHFLLLHLVSFLSFLPWIYINFSLENNSPVSNEEFNATIFPYLLVGFIFATVFSVFVLDRLVCKIDKNRDHKTILKVTVIYLIASVLERFSGLPFFILLSGAAYSIAFGKLFYLFISLVVFLLFTFSRKYLHNLK